MRTPLAWRNITHNKVHTGLATAGIAFAIMLIFVQLGFYGAVQSGATLIYDQLEFDLAMVSKDYVFLRTSKSFPQARLNQALALDQVDSADPFYISRGVWKTADNESLYKVLIFGFDPQDPIFRNPQVQRQAHLLKRPDTALVDYQTRPMYGERSRGTIIELSRRNVMTVGESRLGTAFLELAIVVVSDLTYSRIVDKATVDEVSVGLIRLHDPADIPLVYQRLSESLPPDVRIFTRPQLNENEQNYWTVRTSTGLIFGSGAIVAFIVGTVIMYQALSSQVMRALPEYATLKALGYGHGRISWIVLQQAIMLAISGFIPGWGLACLLYVKIRNGMYLPIEMPSSRVVSVAILSIVMAISSGWLALRKVKLAAPADVF